MIKYSCNLIEWEAQLTTLKIVSLRCCIPLMTNSMQKTSISLDSFQRYWWSRNPTVWLDKRHNWPHPPKSARPGCCLPLLTISLQKSIDCWIFSRHTDDQKFLKSNWTRDKTGHTQPKLPFFDDYLHAKNQIYRLIPSRALSESILGLHWRTRFFPDIGFCRIIKNTIMLHF